MLLSNAVQYLSYLLKRDDKYTRASRSKPKCSLDISCMYSGASDQCDPGNYSSLSCFQLSDELTKV